jgi:hypothetical protein
MQLLDRLLAGVNLPTMVAAALLVLAVIVVIRIGKALVMAALFGAIAGGASLGQGNEPSTAGAHAAIGFGVAAVTFFLVRTAKSFLMWIVITGLAVAALLLWGFRT